MGLNPMMMMMRIVHPVVVFVQFEQVVD